MKSLLESIFGGRENIVKTANDTLWPGFSDASKTIYYPHSVTPGWKWNPKNNNNILNEIYKYDRCRYITAKVEKSPKGELRLYITILPIQYTISTIVPAASHMDPLELLDIAARAFKNHPEMFMNIFEKIGANHSEWDERVPWNKFVKIYLDK